MGYRFKRNRFYNNTDFRKADSINVQQYRPEPDIPFGQSAENISPNAAFDGNPYFGDQLLPSDKQTSQGWYIEFIQASPAVIADGNDTAAVFRAGRCILRAACGGFYVGIIGIVPVKQVLCKT